MAVRITDLVAKPRVVNTGNGEFEVHQISLAQLMTLLYKYRDVIINLFITAKSTGGPDYQEVMEKAPEVVVEIIAMGADKVGDDEEIEAIRNLGAMVQLTAFVEIWEATIPDPKKLTSMIEKIVKMNPSVEKVLPSGTLNIGTLAKEKET